MISYPEAVATVNAMLAVYLNRGTFVETYKRFVGSSRTKREAATLQNALSTYSQSEIDAILNRIANCRKRFELEGSGLSRRKCLCSVLGDVMEGNGGVMPNIDSWAKHYETLNCSSL